MIYFIVAPFECSHLLLMRGLRLMYLYRELVLLPLVLLFDLSQLLIESLDLLAMLEDEGLFLLSEQLLRGRSEGLLVAMILLEEFFVFLVGVSHARFEVIACLLVVFKHLADLQAYGLELVVLASEGFFQSVLFSIGFFELAVLAGEDVLALLPGFFPFLLTGSD